jgi:hypothetical protein
MARKQFALNRTPHVAQLGDDLELHFVPEVMGDEFVEGYVQLQDAIRRLGLGGSSAEDIAGADLEGIKGIVQDLRAFITKLLVPESRDLFARFVVVQDGEEVGVFHYRKEAEEDAERREGATVRDDSFPLPLRVLMELLEWISELYGGAGARPTGSSTASSSPSRRAGRRGTDSSPSKG